MTRAARPAGRAPALMILAAALVGGLAAALLGSASLLDALLIAVVIGGAVMLTVRLAPRGPGEGNPPSQPVSGHGAGRRLPPPVVPVGPPTPRSDDRQPGNLPLPGRHPERPGPDGLVRVRSLPGAPALPAWWENAAVPSAAAPGAAPAPVPVSSYLNSAVIAQCPRCGSFRIDVDETRPEWACRCVDCLLTWTWRPGSQWPAVDVRPGLRGGHQPPP